MPVLPAAARYFSFYRCSFSRAARENEQQKWASTLLPQAKSGSKQATAELV